MQEGVTVRDVMSRDFVGVSESDEVASVLEVMVHEPVTSVIALRGTTPVGVLHALDVLELVSETEQLDGVTVDEVMRTAPDPIGADQDVEAALDRLSSDWDRQLPVTDVDGQLVGVVSESDVLAAAATLFTTGEPTQSPQETVQSEASGGATSDAGTTRSNDVYASRDEEAPVATAGTDAQSDASLTQGVCESCGSLVDDLGGHNGQLLCRECRDV